MSIYLIWILESRLNRSNNQSRATLWVLETCLIVGLLPLMIILITASLSSNTYNKASWRADWTFEGTESMSDNIVCIHMCDECRKSIDSSVCHRPWSISQLIVPIYLLTIEYQVVQFLPSISISEQFESIHVTILQQISILLL